MLQALADRTDTVLDGLVAETDQVSGALADAADTSLGIVADATETYLAVPPTLATVHPGTGRGGSSRFLTAFQNIWIICTLTHSAFNNAIYVTKRGTPRYSHKKRTWPGQQSVQARFHSLIL